MRDAIRVAQESVTEARRGEATSLSFPTTQFTRSIGPAPDGCMRACIRCGSETRSLEIPTLAPKCWWCFAVDTIYTQHVPMQIMSIRKPMGGAE